jgi:ferric-dicitrate binding protein FerR (iron transport regulator)
MSTEETRLAYLFDSYINRRCTDAERKEFFDLVAQDRNAEILQRLIDGVQEQNLIDVSEEKSTFIYDRIWSEIGNKPAKSVRLLSWSRIAIAASIILVLGLTSYLVFFNKAGKPVGGKTEIAKTHDVSAPKDTRAVITLADGSKVYLDSAGSGTIAQQNDVNVVRNANGEISYQVTASNQTESAFNTMYNPRGSKVIALTLSDGSKVWLNSESSIKYPVAFNTATRQVEITGEAYFEVTHDKTKPFHVTVNGMDVQVLGTHFNINSYSDEDQIKTTLFEGSIKVSKGTDVKFVKPGEQAQLSSNGSITIEKDVNLDQAIAWKNGYFYFDKAGVQTVMRQLARWYDIDVRYKGKPTDELFAGKIQRELNLSAVLDILKTTGIKYQLENRTLTIE